MTNWERLFGTPEKTMAVIAAIGWRYPCDEGSDSSLDDPCEVCPLEGAPCRLDRSCPEKSEMLEWLKSEVES